MIALSCLMNVGISYLAGQPATQKFFSLDEYSQLCDYLNCIVQSLRAIRLIPNSNLLSRLFFIDAPSSSEFISDCMLFVTQLLKDVLTCRLYGNRRSDNLSLETPTDSLLPRCIQAILLRSLCSDQRTSSDNAAAF